MKKILWTGIFFLLVSAVWPRPIFAADPHLFLSPSSGSFTQEFIEIKVDTGGQAIEAVDIYLEFPKAILKAESVIKGTVFPTVWSHIKNDEGKLRINAYFPSTQAADFYKGSDGLIAKINFTPLSSGTAEVKFNCTAGSTTETNIVEKTTNKDIIVCSANVNGSYEVSTCEGGTCTPAPTSASTSTPTPTAASSGETTSTATPTMPVTGLPIFSYLFIGVGVISLLLGLGFLIL
jgi:hypothetical protein